MTAWLILAAVRRRWRIGLAGMLVTILVMGWSTTTTGTYYSQVYVVLLAPVSTEQPNTYQYIGRSLVAAAGLVVREVDPTATEPAPVSPEVTLVDRGITHGYRVRMPNSGGQWSFNFERPELDVEVAGSSPEEVRATMAEVVARIRRTLDDGQSKGGTARSQMISSTLSPPDPPVFYARGSRFRALFAILALGIGLTLGIVVGVEQWLIRRMIRPADRAAAHAPDGGTGNDPPSPRAGERALNTHA